MSLNDSPAALSLLNELMFRPARTPNLREGGVSAFALQIIPASKTAQNKNFFITLQSVLRSGVRPATYVASATPEIHDRGTCFGKDTYQKRIHTLCLLKGFANITHSFSRTKFRGGDFCKKNAFLSENMRISPPPALPAPRPIRPIPQNRPNPNHDIPYRIASPLDEVGGGIAPLDEWSTAARRSHGIRRVRSC